MGSSQSKAVTATQQQQQVTQTQAPSRRRPVVEGVTEVARKWSERVPGAEYVELEFRTREHDDKDGSENHNDQKREFLVFLPPSVKSHLEQASLSPLPLLMCLPGMDTFVEEKKRSVWS